MATDDPEVFASQHIRTQLQLCMNRGESHGCVHLFQPVWEQKKMMEKANGWEQEGHHNAFSECVCVFVCERNRRQQKCMRWVGVSPITRCVFKREGDEKVSAHKELFFPFKNQQTFCATNQIRLFTETVRCTDWKKSHLCLQIQENNDCRWTYEAEFGFKLSII